MPLILANLNRPDLPPPDAVKQGPKSKMLNDFAAAMLPNVLASLRRIH